MVLLLGILLQTVLLIRDSWAVPGFLVQKMEKELTSRGWSAEVTNLEFHPSGRISARDISLSPLHENLPMVTAKAITARINLLDLLTGDLSLKRLQLLEGDVFLPHENTLSSTELPAVEDIQILVRRRSNGWEIENLSGRIQTLTFSASGQLPSPPKREGPPADFQETLRSVLPSVSSILEYLEMAESPHLTATLGSTKKSHFQISLHGQAENIQFPDGSIAKHPQLTGNLVYNGETWIPDQVAIKIPQAKSPFYEVNLTNLHLGTSWGPITGPEKSFFPTAANIRINRLESSLLSLRDVDAIVTPKTESIASIDFFSFFSDGTVRGTVEGDWTEGDFLAEVHLQANPNPVLQNPLVAEFGFRRDVFFHRPPIVYATAKLENWKLAQTDILAVAGPVEIDGVSLDRAWATAEVKNGRFIVPQMILAFQDFEALGSYDVDMSDHDYRLFFAGSFRPLHISSWFREWWTHLWEDFEFSDQPMRGDVDIHGVLGKPEAVLVEGSLEADDFYLRGVPLSAASGKIFVINDYVDFYDIEIQRPEGAAKGGFQLWTDPDGAGFTQIDVLADSNFNLSDVAPLFGDFGAGIVSPFQFESPPEIRVSGSIFNEAQKTKTDVKVVGESSAPLVYHGLPIDSLKFNMFIEGDEWILQDLDAKVAEGKATGSARKWQEGEEKRLDLNLHLAWLDLAQATEILSEWRAATSETPVKIPLKNRLTGRIDLDLHATGKYGDFTSFIGDGRFRIRESELAELHMLGLLSRVLSSTPLRFTSLHFSEADSVFSLEPGKVHFSELHLSGPSSALHASGDYLIETKSLNFLVKLHLLRKTPIPLLSTLLSPIMNPISRAMEIHLGGPVSDPQWRFLLGPSNLLSGLSDLSVKENSEKSKNSEEPSPEPGNR